MKKIALLFVILGVVCAMAYAADNDYPKVKVSGKLFAYMAAENNVDDFANFDQDYADNTNDARTYGQARLDVNFGIDVAKDVYAKVAARYEGANNNAKWMNFGAGEDQLAKSKMALQEAYIELSNLFGQPLKFDFGRKQEVFGAPGEATYGNIMAGKDKLDGFKFAYDNNTYYANLHYYIRQRLADEASLQQVEGEKNATIMGINGGIKNTGPLVNGNLYFWNYCMPKVDTEDETAVANDNRSVLGARGDFSIMDGMLTPFVEAALQFGKDKQSDTKENAWLIDLGTGYEQQIGGVTVDGGFRALLVSGDDYKTIDKDEGWMGIDMGYWEEGWLWFNPIANNYDMLKASIGVTPASMEKLRLGLDAWIYTDATQNYTLTYDLGGVEKTYEVSGKNAFNELSLTATYDMAKNVSIIGGINLLLPNKDYMNAVYNGDTDDGIDHGDMAHAIWFETDVKW